jgi:4'-phosphopantetheinyl transferase
VTKAAHDVTVTWVRLPESLTSGEAVAFEKIMTNEERARAARFHFDRDRNQFVVGRALARTLVGRSLGVRAVDVAFTTNAYGCPRITPTPSSGLHFNLSHTRSLVACGIARGVPFGVDVEDVHDLPDMANLARTSFSAREVEDLFALPEARRVPRFFDYWTLKEAYIKARCMGLALPLDAFAFALNGARIEVAFEPRLGDDASAWHFERHALTAKTMLAVAIRAGTLRVINVVVEETTTASLRAGA